MINGSRKKENLSCVFLKPGEYLDGIGTEIFDSLACLDHEFIRDEEVEPDSLI